MRTSWKALRELEPTLGRRPTSRSRDLTRPRGYSSRGVQTQAREVWFRVPGARPARGTASDLERSADARRAERRRRGTRHRLRAPGLPPPGLVVLAACRLSSCAQKRFAVSRMRALAYGCSSLGDWRPPEPLSPMDVRLRGCGRSRTEVASGYIRFATNCEERSQLRRGPLRERE
jgi:hypothetical protein